MDCNKECELREELIKKISDEIEEEIESEELETLVDLYKFYAGERDYGTSNLDRLDALEDMYELGYKDYRWRLMEVSYESDDNWNKIDGTDYAEIRSFGSIVLQKGIAEHIVALEALDKVRESIASKIETMSNMLTNPKIQNPKEEI